MTYRDDRDADRARIEALEAELVGANKRIAELEGRHEHAMVLASSGALALTSRSSASKTWLGAPLDLDISREFSGSFPVDRFEDLVESCRAIVRDPGRTELLKSSLTWSTSTSLKAMGPFIIVTVTVRDGVTRLAVSDRLGQAAGAIYGGVGGGAGGGTIVVPLMAGLAIAPIAAPFLVAGWLAATWFGCRTLFKRTARRRANRVQQVFDALVGEIETAIANVPAKP